MLEQELQIKALFSHILLIGNLLVGGKSKYLQKNNKYILCPLEELKIINIGSVVIENVDIDDTYDKKHKPGFFLQTQAFINNDTQNLCSLDQQINNFDIYYKIAGYK